MTQKLRITTSDLDLIQEAIGYMSKRFFSPTDSILLNEIEERLDDSRRELSKQSDSRLILNNTHYSVFQRVMLSYADELNHPSSDSSNRLRIKRLKTLARDERAYSNLFGRIRSWLMGQ